MNIDGGAFFYWDPLGIIDPWPFASHFFENQFLAERDKIAKSKKLLIESRFGYACPALN